MHRRSPVVDKLASIPPFWRLVLSLIIAGTLLGVWLFAFVHNMLVSGKDLPVALHSPLDADYSADAVAFIPAARIDLLNEAIADQASEQNAAPDEQIATMVDQLRTPVFTVTPYPGMTAVPGAQSTQMRTTATPAPVEPTAATPSPAVGTPTTGVTTTTATTTVLAPSATATSTATRSFIITLTPGYFPTRTFTPTLPYATATKVLYPTAVATATKTPWPTRPPVQVTPTHTQAPSRVPPTQTPNPPTPTRTNVPQQPTATFTQVVPPTWTPAPPPTNTPVPPPTDTPDSYPPPGTDYP